jgi:hypothetical protein
MVLWTGERIGNMHKRPELDTVNPPGQIVNPIPKQECEKLTFDEWLKQHDSRPYKYWKTDDMHCCWIAAQENK